MSTRIFASHRGHRFLSIVLVLLIAIHLIVWFVSIRWSVTRWTPTGAWSGIGDGCVYFCNDGPPSDPIQDSITMLHRSVTDFRIIPSAHVESGVMYSVHIPLWIPLTVLIFVYFVVLKHDTSCDSNGKHICGHCGYDRSGLRDENPCPECGGMEIASRCTK